MEATVDKNFDKLEIYMLRNLLTVPEDVLPWVRLRHYEVCYAVPTKLFAILLKEERMADCDIFGDA